MFLIIAMVHVSLNSFPSCEAASIALFLKCPRLLQSAPVGDSLELRVSQKKSQPAQNPALGRGGHGADHRRSHRCRLDHH